MWMERDPIGEEGGINLYGFVDNNSINIIDYLGCYQWDKDCDCYLTTNEKSDIEKILSKTKEKIDKRILLGWTWERKDLKGKHEVDSLTVKYGNKLSYALDKKSKIKIRCWSIFMCNFSNVGFAAPYLGEVLVCIDKIKKFAGTRMIAQVIIHEMVHAVGKVGHEENPPDNPREWEDIFTEKDYLSIFTPKIYNKLKKHNMLPKGKYDYSEF